jgi:hypothetical protein
MGPLWLGTRFRPQPRAHKGAPLRASGVDRSARPSKVAIMPIMRRIASLEGPRADSLERRSAWQGSPVGSLGHSLKTLDSVELI